MQSNATNTHLFLLLVWYFLLSQQTARAAAPNPHQMYHPRLQTFHRSLHRTPLRSLFQIANHHSEMYKNTDVFNNIYQIYLLQNVINNALVFIDLSQNMYLCLQNKVLHLNVNKHYEVENLT